MGDLGDLLKYLWSVLRVHGEIFIANTKCGQHEGDVQTGRITAMREPWAYL